MGGLFDKKFWKMLLGLALIIAGVLIVIILIGAKVN